jgi:hypothetical protein
MMPADVPDEFREAALSMLQLRAYQEAVEVLKQPEQHQRERLARVPDTFRGIVRNEAIRLRALRKSK